MHSLSPVHPRDLKGDEMPRKGEDDYYFCFECVFCGEDDICRRFSPVLYRKGCEKSCNQFQHWKEETECYR